MSIVFFIFVLTYLCILIHYRNIYHFYFTDEVNKYMQNIKIKK